jgi:glycerol kinase
MVDGGATANDFLMQFQADISGRPVLRPRAIESTALGAAMLAGLRAGFWADSSELEALKEYDRRFEPRMESSERERLKEGWRRALRQTRTR